MYLDNIVLAKNAESSVSYSEILMTTISVSEDIADAEMLALSSEFKSHVLGSEAASDWWPKIKAFFKKIWEALKRLFAKVVAWIMALPNKIVALCKKIYEAWVKRGLEGKMKNLRKNIQKKIVGLNPELARDFNSTDWGFQDADDIAKGFRKKLDDFKKEHTQDPMANIVERVLTGLLTREIIREVAGMLSGRYAEIASDEDSTSHFKEDVSEVCDGVRDFVEDITEKDQSGKYIVNYENLETWYSSVKNETYSKEFKKVSKLLNTSIEVMDRMHERAYKEFETLYKNNDEDGAKMLTLELKGLNILTQGVVYTESFLSKMYATAALNRAKMVIAAIKCFDAEGAKNPDGSNNGLPRNPSQTRDGNNPPPGGSGAGKLNDPAKQENTGPNGGNSNKGKGYKPKEPSQAEKDKAWKEAMNAAENQRKAEKKQSWGGTRASLDDPNEDMDEIRGLFPSVADDPDFAAFIKM